MAPPEAVLGWRMRVAAGVGMPVMIAMVRCPPQGPALHAGSSDGGEDELQHPRGLERAVRKVAVIKTGEREHAQRVQRHRHAYRKPRRTDPEHRQASQMQRNEGQCTQPVDAIGARFVQGLVGLRIHPATQAADARGQPSTRWRGYGLRRCSVRVGASTRHA
jgi:hypothetical protein